MGIRRSICKKTSSSSCKKREEKSRKILLTMKIFYFAFIFPLAFATKCPPQRPDPECDNDYEILCPGTGTDFFTGCPNSAFCMPKLDSDGLKDNDGNTCLNSCPIECDYQAKEKICSGPLKNGCLDYSSNYCVPFNKETNCPGTCEPYCDEAAGEILCSEGNPREDGCPVSEYCARPFDDCPAVCGHEISCNYEAGEQWCDAGTDENECWLGAYCAKQCGV